MKFRMALRRLLALGFALVPLADPAADAPKSVYITLGTNSGPIPNPRRAEPANFLQYDDRNILIDVGEGASWQLAKAGVGVSKMQTAIVSHLSPTEVGLLASRAHVKALVLTHDALPDEAIPKAGEEIAQNTRDRSYSPKTSTNSRRLPGGPPDFSAVRNEPAFEMTPAFS